MPTPGKATRLAFSLALLAVALPLLAGRAAANEVTLKCLFSLWNDRFSVGEGRIRKHGPCCDSRVVEGREAIETRLARAPSQSLEITRVLDLGVEKSWRDSSSGRRLYANETKLSPHEEYFVAPELISIAAIYPGSYPRELYPGRGHGSGHFHWLEIKISRLDLSAEIHFAIFFGKDGRSARLGETWGDMTANNIYAGVATKGTCVRVPKML